MVSSTRVVVVVVVVEPTPRALFTVRRAEGRADMSCFRVSRSR
jgi:hypothetical protein